jgi:type IV pilus assembly protein PilC
MPVYVYRAVTKNGLLVKNRVEAASKQVLMKKLKENELTPIDILQTAYKSVAPKKVKKKNTTNAQDALRYASTASVTRNQIRKMTTWEKVNLYFSKTDKITTRDLMVFTQNFYLLKKANFNNIHALQTIIDGTDNLTFKGILEDILAGVENGENMYVTMEYYSNVFPYIYINMIKVGELSGSLTKSLEQAVRYLDETDSVNKQIRGILVPNILQLVLLLVMLLVGTLYAIPAIQNVFDELGATSTLPAITLAFQAFLTGLMKVWYVPVGIIIAAIAVTIFYVSTPRGKYNFHYFKYTMPIFGKLIFALDFSRFMKAMNLNLENGMRVQDALDVSKNVVNNLVMLSMIESATNNALVGSSWIEPFERSNLASPMITEMLKIGMQTDLIEMTEKLVEYMEIDIQQELDRIMKVLPQVVYIIVGVVLIFFVLVVLVPCIQVYMGNFLFTAYDV